MDPLSDVLRAVRLNGAFFYYVEATAPWTAFGVHARELVPRILPEAEHLISYHILLTGSCWAGLEGEAPMRMEAGDAIIFPHGDPHLLSSERKSHGYVRDNYASPDRYPDTVLLGPGGPPDSTFVCGFLGCDKRPYNPLLASLPACLHVRGVADGWLARFPQQVVTESKTGRIGGETVLTRMAELMFIEVLRRHVEQLPEWQNGWLAGLRDDVVGRALSRLHERPAHPWTLPDLARAIASSRTVLAERFSELVGVPPMLYLTRWRLQLAAEQLSRTSAKVAAIAVRVGYASEAAFSRAFKRETGLSPAEWRRVERERVELGS